MSSKTGIVFHSPISVYRFDRDFEHKVRDFLSKIASI
jgi:hypothetical protein